MITLIRTDDVSPADRGRCWSTCPTGTGSQAARRGAAPRRLAAPGPACTTCPRSWSARGASALATGP